MALLDLYRNPGRSARGYVLDIQADLLSSLATRVVVPLMPETDLGAAASDLNPVFTIDGERYVMLTQALAAVPKRELRQPVASLLDQHHVVLHAIDILLSGV